MCHNYKLDCSPFLLKGTVSRDCLLQVIFILPKPLKIILGSFRFFLVANLALVSTTLAVNFPTGTAGVVDTGGKLNDTGSKFATNGIIRGLGETGSQKNLKSKILWHCPFNL
jgi:hypothetical protein